MSKSHLVHHLTWIAKPTFPEDGYSNLRVGRPQIYQAPSWSWASINARVDHVNQLRHKPLRTIINYKLVYSSPSEFGRVIDSYIRIVAPIAQATFQPTDEQLEVEAEGGGIDTDISLRGSQLRHTSVKLALSTDNEQDHFSKPGKSNSYYVRIALGTRDFYLLTLIDGVTSWVGLILQRTDSNVRGQYRRLGMFLWEKHEEQSFLAFQSHLPLLNEQDYEQETKTGYVITII
jgi:hypothetical protein